MDTQTQQDIALLAAMQKLGHALRRTGVALLILSIVALIGAGFEFPGGVAVTAVALGLIGANGLFMIVRAGELLRVLDAAALVVTLAWHRTGGTG